MIDKLAQDSANTANVPTLTLPLNVKQPLYQSTEPLKHMYSSTETIIKEISKSWYSMDDRTFSVSPGKPYRMTAICGVWKRKTTTTRQKLCILLQNGCTFAELSVHLVIWNNGSLFCRAGNSLIGFLSKSLVFCEKMGEWAIHSKKTSHSLICGEWPERFAHGRSFLVSNLLSDSLTLLIFFTIKPI